MHAVLHIGYDKVRENMVSITRALKYTPGARDELILHFVQHGWLDTTESPVESDLAQLALKKIEEDPIQFGVFIDMLRNTEGMSLIVTKFTSELSCLYS